MAWDRSGVPGAPARTSWYDRDLPTMWRVLENQQSDDHWRLVIGWRKAAELTATHLRRLEQYRTNLAGVWPADRNAAAAAYVARLDFLIQNVRTTHEVAAANYSTLAATVGALAAARRDLKPLHDEYVAKSRALKEYTDLATFNAAAEAPTAIGAAPAGAQDLERLNSRARAIMYTLSHTLVEAEAAIRQPPTYRPTTHWDQGVPDVYGNNGKRAPASPIDAQQPPAQQQERNSWDGRYSPTTTPLADAGTSGPSASGLSQKTLRGSTANDGHANSNRLLSSTGPADRRIPPGSTQQGALPGSVIGAKPVVDRPPASRAAIRVNPIGGVIEGKGVREPANPSSAIPPVLGGMSRNPTERKGRTSEGITDTTWETLQGVPPVIEPRRPVRHDPGPAIGLDR